MKIIALVPILYQSCLYEVGDEIMATDQDIIKTWMKYKSVKKVMDETDEEQHVQEEEQNEQQGALEAEQEKTGEVITETASAVGAPGIPESGVNDGELIGKVDKPIEKPLGRRK